MFEKIKTGVALAKQTFQVIANRKSFLIFPLLSSLLIFMCFSSLLFAGFEILTAEVTQLPSQNSADILSVMGTNQGKITLSILGIIFILLSAFISTIINSALTISAIHYLQEEKTSFFKAFQIVFSHITPLFFWACIVTIVDVIMFVIESFISKKSQVAGDIVDGLEKTAWAIISFFVLPIMIVENSGPITAIKRSASLLKKNWGTALVSSAGIGFFIFILFILIFSPPFIMMLSGYKAYLLPTLFISTVLFICLLIFNATLRTVLRAALYLYATDKCPDKFYNEKLLAGAFKARTQETR